VDSIPPVVAHVVAPTPVPVPSAAAQVMMTPQDSPTHSCGGTSVSTASRCAQVPAAPRKVVAARPVEDMTEDIEDTYPEAVPATAAAHKQVTPAGYHQPALQLQKGKKADPESDRGVMTRRWVLVFARNP
jgi:hypothetical protein